MLLNRLVLQNFRQHADSRIEFGPGVTGIIGPNGAGKTTILEAIAWAIYGNPAARGTRDSIRFNRAGARSGVRVELDFDLGGHNYRVVRGLTNAELYLDGPHNKIADSITGVTDVLMRRLGMTREEFFNTYFTGQKEISVMAAMSPTERAQFLSRVLGYERLRAAQELARDRRRAIVAEIAGLRQGMGDADAIARQVSDAETRLGQARDRARFAERRRDASQAALEEARPRWEAAQRAREAHQALLADLRVAEQQEAAEDREVQRVERDLGDAANARAELERLRVELEPFQLIASEFQRLDVLAREEGRRRALLETQAAIADDLVRLRDRRAKLENAPALETEIDAALVAKRAEFEATDGLLEARRTEWVRDRQEAETKRQALREQYTELKEQRDRIVSLGAEGACPTCARPLGETYRAVLDLLDEQLETVRVDGNYYKARFEQLMEMPEDVQALDEQRRALSLEVSTLERRLTKIQLAVQELAHVESDVTGKSERAAQVAAELEAIPPGYDAARHDKLRAEIERLTPLDARAARLSAQLERVPQLERERASAVERLGAVRARLRALQARREETTIPEADHEALRAEYERVRGEAHAADLALVQAQGEELSAQSALERARSIAAELAARQRMLGELTAKKLLHDELDRAFTDLRTDLNFQLRPELSELASGFLSDLTDGRYGELELDDSYNIVVLEDGVPKPVISGGEEDLANLVLRLAISQMIAERAGQPLSLLILDEIFGSLDEARRANVLDLLRRLQGRFEQVILITHIEQVRECVDRVISVRYDQESGSSVVEQTTPEFPDLTTPPVAGDEVYEAAGAGD
ncbi:MAG TPA: SMC family ATPase [Gemmatimonadaceae bacterium]|nr:SMC family ATPase [Gemmatimonadaceae bacterium]